MPRAASAARSRSSRLHRASSTRFRLSISAALYNYSFTIVRSSEWKRAAFPRRSRTASATSLSSLARSRFSAYARSAGVA